MAPPTRQNHTRRHHSPPAQTEVEHDFRQGAEHLCRRRRLQHTTTKPEQQTPPATPPKNQPKRCQRASQSNPKAVPRPCHCGPPSRQGATTQPDCRQSPADPPPSLRPLQARGRPPPAPPATPPAIDLNHLQIHHARSTDDVPASRRTSRAADERPGHHQPCRTRSEQGTPRSAVSRHHGRPPRCPRSRSGGTTVESPWGRRPSFLARSPRRSTATRSSMPPPRHRVDLKDTSLQLGASRPRPAPKAAQPPPSLGQPELRWDEPSGGGGTRR
nr:nascent polypeptide-associated complex subunit alpha, muscle-specific form-like [Aegilops tauschii subsp. strangulata]